MSFLSMNSCFRDIVQALTLTIIIKY